MLVPSSCCSFHPDRGPCSQIWSQGQSPISPQDSQQSRFLLLWSSSLISSLSPAVVLQPYLPSVALLAKLMFGLVKLQTCRHIIRPRKLRSTGDWSMMMSCQSNLRPGQADFVIAWASLILTFVCFVALHGSGWILFHSWSNCHGSGSQPRLHVCRTYHPWVWCGWRHHGENSIFI